MDFAWIEKKMNEGSDSVAALHDSAARLCKDFGAERITIYRTSEDGTALVAMVQTGLESFGSVKVKIESNRSVAGHVGALRKLVNIGDVYDEKELAPLELKMKMFRAVDERTGFSTRQVLAAPIVSAKGAKLLGVVEFLNRRDKERFPKASEQDIVALCATLAAALERQPQATP